MTTSIAIVGAGPAGLVAARRLSQDGFDVTVFEREDRVGGRVRSLQDSGFVFDRGFQVLFTAYPAARRELDLDSLQLRHYRPGALVCNDGDRQLVADPFREPTKLPQALLSSAITTTDKLRVLRLRRELRNTPVHKIWGRDDDTIRNYLQDRGFSQRFVANFAEPFFGGITLDRSLSTSKRVFEFTFKMLAEGTAAVPKEGMGAVTHHLAARANAAGADIRLETPVDAVDPAGDAVLVEVAGHATRYDAAIVATDPPTAADLTGVESIPTEGHGCITQYFGIPVANAFDLEPRILLNADADSPNLVAPVSVVAPEHAASDVTILSATTLGHRPDESDIDLAVHTRETLADWFPEYSVSNLNLVHTERIEFGQFAQPPGIHERLPNVRDPDGPIYLAGEYTHDASINGALESGRSAANAVYADYQ